MAHCCPFFPPFILLPYYWWVGISSSNSSSSSHRLVSNSIITAAAGCAQIHWLTVFSFFSWLLLLLLLLLVLLSLELTPLTESVRKVHHRAPSSTLMSICCAVLCWSAFPFHHSVYCCCCCDSLSPSVASKNVGPFYVWELVSWCWCWCCCQWSTTKTLNTVHSLDIQCVLCWATKRLLPHSVVYLYLLSCTSTEATAVLYWPQSYFCCCCDVRQLILRTQIFVCWHWDLGWQCR